MRYTLFNTAINKPLKVPVIGIWHTDDLTEAEEMLDSCLEYLDAIKRPDIKKDIAIIDYQSVMETKKNS